jgi:NAD(P)-dependent dehydrogenase (short-subunit alcohol dehydrogenase family)
MPTPQHPINSGFGARSTAAEVLEGIDLSGRLAIVTGGYSGLGLETVRALSGAGAEVIVPARRPQHAAEVLSEIERAKVLELDLGSLDSVFACAQQVLDRGRSVDILINNAAIMACPETRVGPGWEAQFATNHLGHFAFTNVLWPLLADGGGRPSSRSPRRGTSSPRSASTTCSGSTGTRSGRPTARPRPPTACSPSSSTRSARTRASAPSRPIRAGS